jgi:hypothetical protein
MACQRKDLAAALMRALKSRSLILRQVLLHVHSQMACLCTDLAAALMRALKSRSLILRQVLLHVLCQMTGCCGAVAAALMHAREPRSLIFGHVRQLVPVQLNLSIKCKLTSIATIYTKFCRLDCLLMLIFCSILLVQSFLSVSVSQHVMDLFQVSRLPHSPILPLHCLQSLMYSDRKLFDFRSSLICAFSLLAFQHLRRFLPFGVELDNFHLPVHPNVQLLHR